MRVVLVNTFDNGGASRAVYRVHQGLRSAGVDSRMLVRYNSQKDPLLDGPSGAVAKVSASLGSRLDALPLWIYPHRNPEVWSSQWRANDTVRKIRALKPDIVHMHWIGQGFLPIRAFPQWKCPLVWTMHDMWGMTGGCHYDMECSRWRQGCGCCPQLGSEIEDDWSRRAWRAKEQAWKNVPMTVICPSRWLADTVRSSPLFRDKPVHVIPNGLDISVFRPIPKEEARLAFNFSIERMLIVFGAVKSTTDSRKGFRYLESTLRILSERGWHNKAIVGIFGADKSVATKDFGFPTYYLGNISDERRIALLYSAADIFLAPSLQDNLPNTVMEALACGTPCAAFHVGGMPDMIDHKINGYLARPFDVEDLALGIEWVLADRKRHQLLCQSAREKVVRNFSLEASVTQYIRMYEQISEGRGLHVSV